MTASRNTVHEPLLHITKRASIVWWKAWLIRMIAIVAALLFSSVVIVLITGLNPVQVYVSMFEGSFGTSYKMWTLFQRTAMLLCISLAVTPAFKMRFWNLGAEGQVLFGALCASACMFYFGERLGTPLSNALLLPICFAAALIGGIVWAVIPAVFKAKWGTNESLFTLMMNYVAIQLVECFLKVADKTGSNTVGPNLLKNGWLPKLGGQDYLLNILVVAVLTVTVYVYLKYSKHGYEISVVGESENTARYIGINVKKVIIRTMVLSGALCGLMGFLLVAGTSHSIDSNLVDGRGFTAIMVAWMAKFNPFFMVLASLLLVFLDKGASEVSTRFGLNQDYSEIVTGIILFFLIGCEFFMNYQIHINKSRLPARWRKEAVADKKEVQ